MKLINLILIAKLSFSMANICEKDLQEIQIKLISKRKTRYIIN
jgi:hypothetical protein